MMGSTQFRTASWKKDIIQDIKQHHRGGSANYPGPPEADHPYLQTAHLSCKELNAVSEVQFLDSTADAVGKQRERHYQRLKRIAKCLGVNPQR